MDGCHQHHPTSTIIITGFGDNGVGEACCCRQLLAEDSDVITLLLELFTVLFVNDVSLGFLVVSFLSQDDASCQGERKSDADISYQEYRNFKNRTCVMSYFDVPYCSTLYWSTLLSRIESLLKLSFVLLKVTFVFLKLFFS
jgi:hypothetical protein